MKPYTITVIDRRRQRTRYIAMARCWYDAWRIAVGEYGIACLVMVKPWKSA